MPEPTVTQLQVIYTEDLAGGYTVVWVDGSEVKMKDFTDYNAMRRLVSFLLEEVRR